MRTMCVHCGTPIQKSSHFDAYVCRACEKTVGEYGLEERYWYLDRWNE